MHLVHEPRPHLDSVKQTETTQGTNLFESAKQRPVGYTF